jgi:hypothetical protein
MKVAWLAIVVVAVAQQAHVGSGGVIQGHKASQNPRVTEWLGVPYAQPPVGKLRFAPPQEYTPRGLHVASEYVRSHSSLFLISMTLSLITESAKLPK